MRFKAFLQSGHLPTLLASFLYFDFCFAVWVVNGAMAPFITEQFKLSPSQTGFMISVPIFAGALMRFPLGILSQYIGRKNAAVVEMSLVILACVFGLLFVDTYSDVILMGVLLGIAGASFGVALSLGSGWYPKKYKGLAMGIAGAGNSGTAVAALFAPMLASAFGWRAVYGFAAAIMILPLIVMILCAKEPPDRVSQGVKQHLQCLWQMDGWIFNVLYIVTFGGFIGLSGFLPTFFYEEFKVTKIEAGQLTVLATLVGSAMRIVGGYFADKIGGIVTLSWVFITVILLLILLGTIPPVATTTLLLMLCFGALGAGNGAVFQLVPLRWAATTAIAGSMIGEIGALGGSIIPNLMGYSKESTGSYGMGFVWFAAFVCLVMIILIFARRNWTNKWVDKGGRALFVSDEKSEFSKVANE
jgi:NNP family nitrate/nitrite transporter-like MFS transporter